MPEVSESTTQASLGLFRSVTSIANRASPPRRMPNTRNTRSLPLMPGRKSLFIT